MTANSSLTNGFGETLRLERQRRSISLEDISQTTKLTVRSLKALESDEFDQLPGGILGKGIVRSYVRCLGLDEGEWVTRFLAASGRSPDPADLTQKDWASFALNVSSNRIRETSDVKLRWAGVVALLLLLAGFGWIVWGYIHQRAVSAAARQPAHSAVSLLGLHAPAAVSIANCLVRGIPGPSIQS